MKQAGNRVTSSLITIIIIIIIVVVVVVVVAVVVYIGAYESLLPASSLARDGVQQRQASKLATRLC